jgi:hypothetical protein
MPTHHPILTSHRLQRYILWALAILSWIAGVLGGHRVSARHRAQRGAISCAWLTRLVANLLLIRAAHFARFRRCAPQYWRHGRDLRRSHFHRSLLGGKLRRALRHKDFATHIAQLIAVLRDLDAYAKQLARNSYRRRRLWRRVPAIAPAEIILGASALPPAFANSS